MIVALPLIFELSVRRLAFDAMNIFLIITVAAGSQLVACLDRRKRQESDSLSAGKQQSVQQTEEQDGPQTDGYFCREQTFHSFAY